MRQRIYYNEDFSTLAMEKGKVLSEEMRKRRTEGQRAWLSRDKLMFVNVDDKFVCEITAALPHYILTDPVKRFKARPRNQPPPGK